MTKEKNKNQYVQKYRKEWELDVNFKGWLSEVPGDSQAAHCKLCKSNLKAHKKNLNDHLNSTKHKEAIKRDKTIVLNQKINTFIKPTILEERKIVELRIAAFIAKNCSIRAVDELSVLIKSLDKSSKILNDIKLHRTKCTSLVLNVIAPCMLQELIDDIVTKACDDAYIKATKDLTDRQQKNLVSQKFTNDIYGIKERFKLFLVTLGCELQKRVPKNIDILKTMSLFSIQDMNLTFPKDISGIASTFENISGGTVDDINKLRNQMSVKTAEAILRVKDNLPNSALFTPTKEMLKKFCSSEMYNSEVDESVINTLSEL
ncbi:hypothetical protein KQX54_013435 [Cotesia glomerata]|uniref:Uncharacterized protein n=1 Tax=Cotesia glomerata TaxID=32391 RepID=A0AAV7IDC5_COTGL|nr:hypothetical protein KQX54_013435 [Cotesia glomerata]